MCGLVKARPHDDPLRRKCAKAVCRKDFSRRRYENGDVSPHWTGYWASSRRLACPAGKHRSWFGVAANTASCSRALRVTQSTLPHIRMRSSA
jgi:hypothetical protein